MWLTLFALAGNPAKFSFHIVLLSINLIVLVKKLNQCKVDQPPEHLCCSFQFPTASPSLGHTVILSDGNALCNILERGRKNGNYLRICLLQLSSRFLQLWSCWIQLCLLCLQLSPQALQEVFRKVSGWLLVNIITWFLSSSSWQVFSARATSCRRPPSSLWSSSFCNARNWVKPKGGAKGYWSLWIVGCEAGGHSRYAMVSGECLGIQTTRQIKSTGQVSTHRWSSVTSLQEFIISMSLA